MAHHEGSTGYVPSIRTVANDTNSCIGMSDSKVDVTEVLQSSLRAGRDLRTEAKTVEKKPNLNERYFDFDKFDEIYLLSICAFNVLSRYSKKLQRFNSEGSSFVGY